MHGASFLNCAWNSCCTVITDLDTSKWSTQKAFSCCDAILETDPAVSTSEWTPGSAWETWTVAATNGVRFARVKWEINFLLTFETAPFICKHPVCVCWKWLETWDFVFKFVVSILPIIAASVNVVWQFCQIIVLSARAPDPPHTNTHVKVGKGLWALDITSQSTVVYRKGCASM